MKLNIKPMSVNEAWQGKRFKTNKYKSYERDIIIMLPKMDIPQGKLVVNIRFGFSNKCSDIDNPVKCFVDCLQKKYGFNDRDIYAMNLEKLDVKKGEEFIFFTIKGLDND